MGRDHPVNGLKEYGFCEGLGEDINTMLGHLFIGGRIKSKCRSSSVRFAELMLLSKQIGENLKSGRSVRKDAFRLLALDTTKTLYTDSFRLIRLPLFHIFVCIS